jgi:hypothetical protein
MAQLDEIFSKVGVKPESPVQNDVYKVNPSDGKNGEYNSIIRFIPYYANPAKCTMQKYVAYVKNPVLGKGMYIDDPRTIGADSPITSMFFQLYNSKIERYMNFAKEHLSSTMQYASLVQIIRDEQHPEYEGRIMVFRYGKKLYDKIYHEQYPKFGEGINPFHPIYGRYFYLTCTKQGKFNNFEQSSFNDNRDASGRNASGMYIKDAASNQMVMVTEQTNQQAVLDYLTANSPDLSKYDYHPMTEEQNQFLNETIKQIATMMQNGTIGISQTSQYAAQQSPVANMQINNSPVFPGATMQPQTQSPVTPQMQAPQQAAPTTSAPTMAPAVGVAQSNIQGAEAPAVEPQSAPQSGYTAPAGLGNLDDILAQM